MDEQCTQADAGMRNIPPQRGKISNYFKPPYVPLETSLPSYNVLCCRTAMQMSYTMQKPYQICDMLCNYSTAVYARRSRHSAKKEKVNRRYTCISCLAPVPTQNLFRKKLWKQYFLTVPVHQSKRVPSHLSSKRETLEVNMPTVYILELKHRRYYVGQTRHLDRRYASHEAGEEGPWTAKYRPRRVVRAKRMSSNHAAFHENYYVARLMLKHGIQYVRGGRLQKSSRFTCDDRDDVVQFLSEYLDASPERISEMVDEQVKACGRRRCPICARDDASSDSSESSASSDSSSDSWDDDGYECTRCGRTGHSSNGCEEIRDTDGHWLRGCGRCGRMHREEDCYSTTDACGRRLR